MKILDEDKRSSIVRKDYLLRGALMCPITFSSNSLVCNFPFNFIWLSLSRVYPGLYYIRKKTDVYVVVYRQCSTPSSIDCPLIYRTG